MQRLNSNKSGSQESFRPLKVRTTPHVTKMSDATSADLTPLPNQKKRQQTSRRGNRMMSSNASSGNLNGFKGGVYASKFGMFDEHSQTSLGTNELNSATKISETRLKGTLRPRTAVKVTFNR